MDKVDSQPNPIAAAVVPVKKGGRARFVALGLVSAAVIGGGTWWLLTRGQESTDDAQVEGHVQVVAARVTGQVQTVLVKDNQAVKTGDILVELDKNDLDARAASARADLAAAQAALASARAQEALTEKTIEAVLKQARGGVTQASSGVASFQASVEQARADLSAAEARSRLAQSEFDRTSNLYATGALSQAELDSRRSLLDQATASVEQARARLSAARAGISSGSGGMELAQGRLAAAETGPQQVANAQATVQVAEARVGQAQAALRLAELNLGYATIRSPSDGVVARRTVEVGQLVSPDRALLAVVPLDDVWIVANFKEDQAAKMHPGQTAKVHVDAFSGDSRRPRRQPGRRHRLALRVAAARQRVGQLHQGGPARAGAHPLRRQGGPRAAPRPERQRHRQDRLSTPMADEIRGSKVLITVVVMCAALMAVLDISIVNVAISDIRASFGTPIDQIAWVSTGYMMANIVVIPMTGWLQRKFGYRRYFSVSILIFTAASALCGLAWNLPSLVLFRVLQGLGGGAIIPTSQAILFARYPREEHGMAGAMFGLGAVTGPLLGPTLGGYLIDHFSWHWIFLINVPLGLGAAFMSWKVIDQPGHKDPKEPVDRWGIALLAVGMASMQYVLEEGNRDGWLDSPLIIVLAVVAIIALVTFVVHELEHDHPVVDLRIFANRSYAAATGINFLTGTALFSSTFLFSLYCGAVMHYSALDIGMLFLKGSFIQLLIMPLIGRFGGKFDGRVLVAFGVSVMCISLWTNGHLTALADEHAMIMPIFIRSLGLGFVFVPLSVLALSDLPPNKRGNAAGLFNLTRELGGSIGTAFMSFQLDRHSKAYYAYMSEKVNIWDSNTMDQLRQMMANLTGRVADPQAAATLALANRVNGQALVRSFNDGFMQLVFIFLFGVLLTMMMKKARSGVAAGAAH